MAFNDEARNPLMNIRFPIWFLPLIVAGALSSCELIEGDGGQEGQTSETVFGANHSLDAPGGLNEFVSNNQISNRSPLAAVHKISITVGRKSLTPSQINQYAALSVISKGELNRFANTAMAGEGFRQSLTYWCNQLLEGLHQYERGENALNLVSEESYPNRKWYRAEGIHQGGNLYDVNGVLYYLFQRSTNSAVMNQTCNLMIYLVEQNIPFTNVLTANYLVGDDFLELALGVRTYDDSTLPDRTLRPIFVPNRPIAGVLTDPVFLRLHTTTSTNVNRHRAWFVLRQFFDTDVLATNSRVNVQPTVLDNPTMNAPECAVCHRIMDPLAGTFKNWDRHGRYRPQAWPNTLRRPGLSELFLTPSGSLPNALQWVAGQMADDPRFAVSMVKRFFQIITGNRVLSASDPDSALYDAQQNFFNYTAVLFWAENYDFRVVIREIVTSPFFLGLTSVELVPNFGSRRVLTPELLSAKTEAIFGRRWASGNGTDYLTDPNQYLQIMGGNNNRVRTIDAMNSTILSVVRRMANEISCSIVSLDFSRKAGERQLFLNLNQDTSFFEILPVKNTIRFLNQKILGITPSFFEIQNQYAALLEIQAAGQAAIAAGFPVRLEWNCRRSRDEAGNLLPPERVVDNDPEFNVRGWSAFLKALMLRAEYIHE